MAEINLNKEKTSSMFVKQFAYMPTKVFLFPGAIEVLRTLPMPGKKALILTSNGKSVFKNGAYDKIVDQLNELGVEYVRFSGIKSNPNIENITDGSRFGRENDCDFIIAVGGGSVIDASKCIGICMRNEGSIWDYVAVGTGGKKTIENNSVPIIAIGTTAGTGSEVDFGAVVTNEETHEKLSVRHDSVCPKVAIIDPNLMTAVPPTFTAYQGFDAFLHCAEAYISNKANYFSDMVSLEGVRHIAKNLPIAVKDGSNIEARSAMAFGSLCGGFSMVTAAVTSGHAMEHALSGYHNELPHGAGLIMDCVANFSFFVENHACDERFITLARAMGKEDANDPRDFIEMLEKLKKDCGVDNLKMSDWGITPDEFSKMADDGLGALHWLFTCDRIPLTKEDVIDMYQKSYR